MAVKLLNINKLKRLKWPVIGCLILIIVTVIYFPNYARIRSLRQENSRLTEEIKKLSVEIIDYEDKLSNLDGDPYLYERIARDDLGIARENEIIIDIEE
ncbi:MAG: septum formation initiator family protein [Candidatus Omnitrophica bacterium]|nr:septum formation initiator family protein [Candidatus Omnitrophota bacterium]